MIKTIVALAAIAYVASGQGLTQGAPDLACCLDHPDKPTSGPTSNYDCSLLTVYGKDRCNAVWKGTVCQWAVGDECKPKPKPCQRVDYFREIRGQKVNVGMCAGECQSKGFRCKPKTYETSTLNDGTEVRVIKDCSCNECAATEDAVAVEIPSGRCEGECPESGRVTRCRYGQADNYGIYNPEPSSPSIALQQGFGSICSWGIQPGFDYFADNMCFAHTIRDCFAKSDCPIRNVKLTICMQAANVPLTHTDSLILGVGGSSLWGKRLPDLNGGTWNRGEKNCFNFDLDNLPPHNGVTSILSDVEAAGHLDIVVQDDTAIDYIDIAIEREPCSVCIPTSSYVSYLYSQNGVKEFVDVTDCDCVEATQCSRAPHHQTFYGGTRFERQVDVGQCIGSCGRFSRCHATSVSTTTIEAPEGERDIRVIKECNCRRPVLEADGSLVYDKV